jgi:hypothetical protein
MREVAQGHQILEERRVQGKVVLRNEPPGVNHGEPTR